MTLDILDGLRALHVDRNWFAAHWLRPARRESCQGTASKLTRLQPSLGNWAGRICWTVQVDRTLPPECALIVNASDVARARSFPGIDNDPGNRSISATATGPGAGDNQAPKATRGYVHDLFAWAWRAIAEERQRARLRKSLHRLTDRELKDIGLCRGEIDSIVAGAQRPD